MGQFTAKLGQLHKVKNCLNDKALMWLKLFEFKIEFKRKKNSFKFELFRSGSFSRTGA